MSDFLAEARVVVKPDTTKFRTQLQEQIRRAVSQAQIPAVQVPVAIGIAGAGIAAATAAVAASQKVAAEAALGLASTEQLLTTKFGQQAVILKSVEQRTLEVAGAQAVLDRQGKKTTASLLGAEGASARLNAGLLGLRTAVGSAAVIGLGALSLAAIAAGQAVSASIRNFAAFQQELATFRVVAEATADQMRAVSAQATRLGADIRLPGVSAGDAAIAMTELAKAGLSVEEAIAGAEGVLQLATAAQISNAEAAKIAANALNSFGLAGDEAARVADNLANAANAAQGSISDFGFAFAQASAVARQVGLSLEDTTALLSLFAKNGLQGSDAGTSLRVALIRLVAPTKQAAEEIRRLGLDIRDAQGNVRADVFAQFGEATRNLSPSVRDASAALIFGQDAIRAVAIGAREGADGLRLMQFQIDQQGTAAEIAAAKTEGLAGALSGAQSAGENLSKTLGSGLAPALENTAGVFTNVAIAIDAATAKIIEFNREGAKLRDSVPGGKEAGEFFKFFAVPGKAAFESTKIIARFAAGTDETAQKISQLNAQLQELQTARIQAEEGGQRGVADRLTKEIKALREEIKLLKAEGSGISDGVTAPLQEAIDTLERARDIRIELGIDTTPLDRLIASLRESIPITQHVEGNIQRLRDDYLNLGDSAKAGASGVDALTRALRGLATESGRAQAELLKLQTEGGSPQEQIAVLQADIATQFEIIARQKARGGASGAATAIRQAREQIKSNQAEIRALQSEITSDAKAAADEAERRRDEQDDAVQRQLDAATSPIQRLLDRAALTAPLKDDIRFTTQLIVLYRRQIEQATKRIQDVETRNRILKALGDKLFAAILSRRELQKQERERIRAALEERLERVQTGIQLDIELADLNENTKRSINLRLKLIAQLKKEARVLKLQGNALKENRNERARLRKEIEDLQKEGQNDKSARRQAAEFLFSQLQAQQGFASNLLGNFIASDKTAGLVGLPSPPTPATGPGRGVAAAAVVAEGKAAGGPTAGQASTTNDILLRILRQLQTLNGTHDAPEAISQRKSQNASGDGVTYGF